MLSRWKKLILAILFTIVVVALGYAIYAVFFRPITPIEVIPPTNEPTVGGLPVANVAPPVGVPTNVPVTGGPGLPGAAPTAEEAAGGLTQAPTLVATVVQNPQMAGDGRNILYYDRSTGQFLKLDAVTGTSVPLSNTRFPDVQAATWDPTGKAEAILEFPDNRKIFFDFDKQQQVTLPSHWTDFTWAPSGNEVAAKSLGASENNRFLILTNPDGSNARPVAELGRNEALVDLSYSPNNDMIAFARTGQAQTAGVQDVIPIGKHQENFRALTVEGLGFLSMWTPDGARILYSAANATSNWKPALWIVDGRGDTLGTNRKYVGLQTWVDKCTFASPTVAYCAVPRDLPTGAAFGRAVANSTPDDIYRLDIQLGTSRLIATPEQAASITKLLVSGDGNTLFYTETLTGALKKLQLR